MNILSTPINTLSSTKKVTILTSIIEIENGLTLQNYISGIKDIILLKRKNTNTIQNVLRSTF